MKYLRLGILIIIATLFIGCASSEITMRQIPQVKFNQFTDFYFKAETNIAEDVKEELLKLETEVSKRITSINKFQHFSLGEAKEIKPGVVSAKAVITKINKVSGVATFFLGVFAGRDQITIEVTFKDIATGNSFCSFTITEGSNTIGPTIEFAAEKIAETILQNY